MPTETQIYTFISWLNSQGNLAINITGSESNPTAGTALDVFTALDDPHQLWTMVQGPGSLAPYFFIQSILKDPDGKPLVISITGTPGAKAPLAVENPVPASNPKIYSQLWTWVASGKTGPSYLASGVNSDLVLNVTGSSETPPPETPIDVFTANGGRRQFWEPALVEQTPPPPIHP
jgi:hypothetical protein